MNKRNIPAINSKADKSEDQGFFDCERHSDQTSDNALIKKVISNNETDNHNLSSSDTVPSENDEPYQNCDSTTNEIEQIPCEYCNSSVSIDSFDSHLRQCITNYNQRRALENSENTEDSSLPCEFCNILQPLEILETHQRTCRQHIYRNNINTVTEQTDPVSRAPSSFSDTMNDEILIPCQYCDEPQAFYTFDTHQKQCRSGYGASNTDRSRTGFAPYPTDINSDKEPLIPCEYCNKLQEWSVLDTHQKQCRNGYVASNTDRSRTSNTATTRDIHSGDETLIPCQYCEKLQVWSTLDAHQVECRNEASKSQAMALINNQLASSGIRFPDTWNLSSMENLTRFVIYPESPEYDFVREKFAATLAQNKILQIERIQNRRWYRQYDAHKDDFIDRYGKSTELWLFHGCPEKSVESIVKTCFDRSHTTRSLLGQGIYFATDASISYAYSQPSLNGYRFMFLARVLVGKRTNGNSATRVCPEGFDTTGNDQVYVVYHDAQSYGEYLITFQ